ncbi:MAG: hypothetical protein IPI77_22990 [Saprospiraceae bacterium]|nr:hypothetical protein [Saprospiraceae bacterium]
MNGKFVNGLPGQARKEDISVLNLKALRYTFAILLDGTADRYSFKPRGRCDYQRVNKSIFLPIIQSLIYVWESGGHRAKQPYIWI